MHFWIPGDPQPQPRGRAGKTKKGKPYIYNDYGEKALTWKSAIKQALFENCRFGFENYDSAGYCIALWFQFRRPKDHYIGNKRTNSLKEFSPELHVQKPDVDNLAKLVMDDMEKHNRDLAKYENLFTEQLKESRIYENDSQVVKLVSMKSWAADPGCLASIVQINTLEEFMRVNPFND